MDLRARLASHWPLYGLVVSTPWLELRYPTEADLATLAELSADIHDPGFLPFSSDWTLRPDDERRRGLFQFHWARRGELTPERWSIPLATVVEGEVVGVQGLEAEDFTVRRTVETGSWLARARQGRGTGKEMRAAALHLAFEGLEAARAETGALAGNEASLGVTRSLGYRPNGDRVQAVQGERRVEARFVLDWDDWLRARRDDVSLSGLEPCLPLLGAAGRAADERGA